MSDSIVTRITVTILLPLMILAEADCQENRESPVKIMFYNVENLFDTKDDTLTDDDEFLPDGLRRWNAKRYRSKINSIYKVIAAAGEWDPPQIIGLSEVENMQVIEDIVYSTGLSRYNFGILHKDSPDPRGIDVCMLYLKDRIELLNSFFMAPVDSDSLPFASREVLYAKCLAETDTLHIFVCHWPSRRGGVLTGEGMRLKIAEMIKHAADSIASSTNDQAKIIIMGDFNSTPEDSEILRLKNGYRSGLSVVNLASGLPRQNGSYKYMGTWELIDQVLISEALISGDGKLIANPGMFRIFSPGFLLERDPAYTGMKPFSTYNGYRYSGGFSDHLPVLLELEVRKSAQPE